MVLGDVVGVEVRSFKGLGDGGPLFMERGIRLVAPIKVIDYTDVNGLPRRPFIIFM